MRRRAVGAAESFSAGTSSGLDAVHAGARPNSNAVADRHARGKGEHQVRSIEKSNAMRIGNTFEPDPRQRRVPPTTRSGARCRRR